MKELFWVFAILSACLLLVCGLSSCMRSSEKTTAETAYTAEHAACIMMGKVLIESKQMDRGAAYGEVDACRERVRKRWNIVLDGGSE